MRQLSNWLIEYGHWTEPQEAPPEFHFWCGVSVLAMAVGRHLRLEKGAYTLRPNMYIVLIAESAKVRKSGAIRLAEMLVRDVNISVMANRVTAPVIVLHGQRVAGTNGDSEICIISDEMKTQWRQADDDVIAMLTALYDSRDHWDNETIGRGYEELTNICVNLLAGTTPEWAALAMPQSSVAGGFWGRVIVVNSGDASKENADPELDRHLYKALLNDLIQIRNLHGAFTRTPEAIEAYRLWYHEVRTGNRLASSVDGAIGRIHDHVQKLAMILSVSRSNDLVITGGDIKSAVDIVEGLFLGNPHELLSEKVEQQHAMKIRVKVQKLKTVFHSDLLRLCSHNMDSSEFSNAINYLCELGEVDRQLVGRKSVYVWKGAK